MDAPSTTALDATGPLSGKTGKQPGLPQDARAIQGVWLLLASLSVFFLASIVLFVVYVSYRVNTGGLTTQKFYLPRSFVLSTLLLVGISVFLEMAIYAARRDRTAAVQRNAIIACVMGVSFLFIQTDGMYRLILGMRDALSVNDSAYAYTFMLVFLHALHVVGGMIGLWWTARNAVFERYDHERNFGIRFCALYWHFLDAVWVALIVCFAVAGTVVNARG